MPKREMSYSEPSAPAAANMGRVSAHGRRRPTPLREHRSQHSAATSFHADPMHPQSQPMQRHRAIDSPKEKPIFYAYKTKREDTSSDILPGQRAQMSLSKLNKAGDEYFRIRNRVRNPIRGEPFCGFLQ